MKTIWKYPLAVTDRQTITMKYGAKVISAQPQGESLCLWAIVDPNEQHDENIIVHVAGTGHELPADIDHFTFVSTVQFSGGALVFHVFIS